jgi:hypothetical protein
LHAYYCVTGANVDEHDHFQENLPEHLIRVNTCGLALLYAVVIMIVWSWQTLDPGERMVEATVPATSYVIRSSDMRSRLMITFERNQDAETSAKRPFLLTFANLAYGDRGGDQPLELQHGKSGYIWLEGGHYVAHSTGPGHRFVFRDVNKEEMLTVVLFEMEDKEL